MRVKQILTSSLIILNSDTNIYCRWSNIGLTSDRCQRTFICVGECLTSWSLKTILQALFCLRWWRSSYWRPRWPRSIKPTAAKSRWLNPPLGPDRLSTQLLPPSSQSAVSRDASSSRPPCCHFLLKCLWARCWIFIGPTGVEGLKSIDESTPPH